MNNASGPRLHEFRERLSRLLRDPKTWTGLSNSFGGLVVWALYVLVRP